MPMLTVVDRAGEERTVDAEVGLSELNAPPPDEHALRASRAPAASTPAASRLLVDANM